VSGKRVSAAALLVSAAVLVGCGQGESASTGSARTVERNPHYALTPTSRCLKGRGAKVGAVQPRNERLRAFRDFVQRKSFQAAVRGQVVALAFLDDPGRARIIADLLKVPNDPYRLVRKGNVVLMYRPSAKAAFTTAVSCLRS
jgi:hypothetical protein